ncbi:MAG: glutamate--tRNA ligase [Saprospiraceae bacterium]|jgi:glutamyl-tRNA synthetase
MQRPVRLRFAPSPTGPLHIGGIRTALYNYLFAKQHNGAFILRVEDTDQGRYVAGAEAYIIECLKWVGLFPDEGPGFGGNLGPYRQSERKEIYRDHAQLLIEKGEAYYAFDTEAALNELRASNGGNQKYDFNTRLKMRNSLTLSEEDCKQELANNTPYVIRLKVPANEDVLIQDLVRGSVRFHTVDLDDKVLIKSDGMPTYHMANVVDDYLMQITHVIRGEEWLSSTAHHVLLYQAFGWIDRMPEFAHLPLILKPTGNGKLSKRDGAQFGFPVFPIDWKTAEGETYQGFREYGFEPDALLNFLAFLGWNDGTDQEIFTLDEMIQAFSIEKIVKSGARFDFEKGKWFNQQYMHRKSTEACVERILHDYQKQSLIISQEEANTICDLYKDRVHFFKDFFEQSHAFFKEHLEYDSQFIQSKLKPDSLNILSKVSSFLENQIDWQAEQIESELKEFIKNQQIKAGELFPLLRVCMTGIPTGPDVFKMIAFQGKTKLIQKINLFIKQMPINQSI